MPEPIISFKWNNDKDSIKIGLNHLYLRSRNKFYQYQFSEIISADLLSKKKLAPLVIGAVLSSLAMVNILLEGAGLYMIGFLFIGLIILYFGLSDYWVIQVVQATDTTQLWISKNKTQHFPEVIFSVIRYRITQGEFPPLYTTLPKTNFNEYIEEKNEVNPGKIELNYSLLPPKPQINFVILKIDASKLSNTIDFEKNSGFLAKGYHKINKTALLGMEV